MNTERFVIFLLGCALAYMYFFGTPEFAEPQQASQPITIDTSQPATVIYNTPPPWPTVAVATPAASPTNPAVLPVPNTTLTSDDTAEPQRGGSGEQGNERGENSRLD